MSVLRFSVLLLPPLLLAVAGCRTADPGRSEDPGAAQARAWEDLNRLKALVRWRHHDEHLFTFPGHGEITVRDWALEGGVDWEYVRADFTYRNTTEQPMERVDVVLRVLDAEGEPVAASRVTLQHPLGVPLMPGNFFSDRITAPTQGAHRNADGWHWEIEAIGIPERPVEPIDSFRSSAGS